MTDSNDKENVEASGVASSDMLAAFQFYDGCTCIKDVYNITLEEARSLWDEHKDEFAERCRAALESDGDCVEMYVWRDMTSDVNYDTKDRSAHSGDFKIIHGELCEVIPFS